MTPEPVDAKELVNIGKVNKFLKQWEKIHGVAMQKWVSLLRVFARKKLMGKPNAALVLVQHTKMHKNQ